MEGWKAGGFVVINDIFVGSIDVLVPAPGHKFIGLPRPRMCVALILWLGGRAALADILLPRFLFPLFLSFFLPSFLPSYFLLPLSWQLWAAVAAAGNFQLLNSVGGVRE